MAIKYKSDNPFRLSDVLFGTPGPIRTADTQVRSLVLYPAELRAQNNCALYLSHYGKKLNQFYTIM